MPLKTVLSIASYEFQFQSGTGDNLKAVATTTTK